MSDGLNQYDETIACHCLLSLDGHWLLVIVDTCFISLICGVILSNPASQSPPLTPVSLYHSPWQTIEGAVWKKHTGGVSWKLSKLDHLLLGCSRMMFLLFKFTSKVPNNAKQLGRTATTQQGLKWLLMWIRLHYPVGGRRGVDTERWCYVSAKDNALNATLQQWEGICLINFQRFLLSMYLKAILLKPPNRVHQQVKTLNKCSTSLKISSISCFLLSPTTFSRVLFFTFYHFTVVQSFTVTV